jgi:hypothetical protein
MIEVGDRVELTNAYRRAFGRNVHGAGKVCWVFDGKPIVQWEVHTIDDRRLMLELMLLPKWVRRLKADAVI